MRVVDTAGLRATEDEVEAEGVRRALVAAEQADLHVAVVDALVRGPCVGWRGGLRVACRPRPGASPPLQRMVQDDAFPDLAATMAPAAAVVVLNKVDALGAERRAEQLARAKGAVCGPARAPCSLFPQRDRGLTSCCSALAQEAGADKCCIVPASCTQGTGMDNVLDLLASGVKKRCDGLCSLAMLALSPVDRLAAQAGRARV